VQGHSQQHKLEVFSLERVPCNLCEADDPELIYAENPLQLVRCRNCKLVYVSPRLTEDIVLSLYNQQYFHAQDEFVYDTRIFKGGYRDYLGDQEYYLQTFRKRMHEIEKRIKRAGHVLDIGCAAGYFLTVARERSWEVEGVEPSAYVADYAKKQLRLKVHNETLNEIQLPKTAYDLVTIWDALEHVPDPRQTLAEAYRILRTDGLLVVSTHDIGSLVARLLGSKWYQLGLHLHLYYFSHKTIRQMLTIVGFRDITVTRKTAGKVCSFRFLVDKLNTFNPTQFKLANKMLNALPALARRGIYINPGDEIIAYAWKKA
jgi:SAM-dependent methyltransferase